MPLCPKCGDALPDDAQFCPRDGEPIPVLVGRELDGRYRVESLMAAGGVGAVYRGTHLALDSPVAIKVLRGTFASVPEFVVRFKREARAMSAIRHVNVVAVVDYGVADDTPYIVMELLDGRSLHDEIRGAGRIRPERAFAIGRQILAALSYAHGRGVVHRDLKPSNVMLVDQTRVGEVVKILDFGLAKFASGEDYGPRGEPLTRSGTVFGTPGYMAPEQAAGRGADARSDIYACGVMLYEMLVGRRPFHDASGPELTRRRLLETPPTPSEVAPEAEIPEAVDAVVMRALKKMPAERYSSADELAEALSAALPGPGRAESTIPPAFDSGVRPVPHSPLGIEATIPLDSGPGLQRVGPEGLPTPPERTPIGPPGSHSSSGPSAIAGSPRPRRRGLVLLGVSAAALALVGTSAVLGVQAARRGPADPRSSTAAVGGGTSAPEADPPEPHGAEAAGLLDAAAAAADGGAGPAGSVDAAPDAARPSRDPFAEPLPPELAWLQESVARSSRSRAERRRRSEVTRRYRDDPRTHLILGHEMAQKGWFSDALERYAEALELDPAVRGDPRLDEHLLDAMAARRRPLRDRALELLRSAHGAATPEVLLRGAYEHPRRAAARAAVAALDELGWRTRLDPVLHGLGEVRRDGRCADRRAALDGLRGRRDPRIRQALEALGAEDPAAAECLRDLLPELIEGSI